MLMFLLEESVPNAFRAKILPLVKPAGPTTSFLSGCVCVLGLSGAEAEEEEEEEGLVVLGLGLW